MSLDVYLIENGNEVYRANTTHNLGKMASEAGIYACLWRPDENGITHARQIIEPLAAGVVKLATEQAKFEAYNPPNGWGTWQHFLPWCARYLQACRDHPDALVEVSRQAHRGAEIARKVAEGIGLEFWERFRPGGFD